MSVMNAFMAGGELMKDLRPFIRTDSGVGVDYARYSITRYPGTGSGYTHIFSGFVHFTGELVSSKWVTITIPESYKINSNYGIAVVSKDDTEDSYSTKHFTVTSYNTAIEFFSQNFQGFIFPSFLCYK